MKWNKNAEQHTLFIAIFAALALLVLVIGGMMLYRGGNTFFGFSDPQAFDTSIRACMNLVEQRNAEMTDTDRDGIYDLCDPCILHMGPSQIERFRTVYNTANLGNYHDDALHLSSFNIGFQDRVLTEEEIRRHDFDMDGIPNACDYQPERSAGSLTPRRIDHSCNRLIRAFEDDNSITVELRPAFSGAYNRCIIRVRE